MASLAAEAFQLTFRHSIRRNFFRFCSAAGDGGDNFNPFRENPRQQLGDGTAQNFILAFSPAAKLGGMWKFHFYRFNLNSKPIVKL